MTTTLEPEVTVRRQAAEVYERARRRDAHGTHDSAFKYLAQGRAKSRTAADWHVAVPAYRYARGQLARITEEHIEAGLNGPCEVAYHRVLHILREVLAEDSVFPTMSIDDDGGILAEWRFGAFGLEIDVAPGGAFSFTVRQDGKQVGEGRSMTPLRKLIRDVSAIVSDANPNWRALFQQSSASAIR